MPGFGDLTWELCRRADQSVLATLADRRPGARVEIGRGVPRTATVELAASDPASALVSEGDTLIRVKVAGWADPLFVGRVTGRQESFDGETETIVVNAIDPLVHLGRAVINNSGIFPSGIRSYRSFQDDQVQVITDLLNTAEASNDTGLLPQASPPVGSKNADSFFSGDRAGSSFHWASPANAATEDGAEAVADVPATATLNVQTHYLRATDWDLGIPSDATITGIQLDVKCRALYNSSNTSGNMTTNDVSVRLYRGGAYVGSEKANAAEWLTGSSWRTYGGDGDLWGLSWTPADLNAIGFGAAVAAQSTIASGFGITQDFYIDYIRVTVYWKAATGERYFTPAIRSLSFPAGSAIGDDILSIFGMDGAPEFEVQPVEAVDGTLARFNFFIPRQGSDKTVTHPLTIGDPDPAVDNVVGLSYTPAIDGLVNQYLAIGDASGTLSAFGFDWPTHPAVLAKHQASIDQFGVWETSEALSGLTNTTKLADAARAMVAANAFPAQLFSVDLDPDTAPSFDPDGDIWMGDVIALHAELPEETLDLEGRIATATIAEDENGDCDVTLACEPDHDLAGVTTTQQTVIVDASDGQVPPPPEPPPEPDETPPASKTKKKKKKKKKK